MKANFLLSALILAASLAQLDLCWAQEALPKEQKLDLKINTENKTLTPNIPLETTTSKAIQDDIQTSPTVTSSLHQVWTSSSSDDLSELSPELISKLHGDVPFLEAYALRPRLVGGGLASNSLTSREASINPKNMFQQKPVVGEPAMAKTIVAAESTQVSPPDLLIGQGTNKVSSTRQRSPRDDPLSKLGNFNELKIETSSTSKSEHHHKRKTSLKRKPQAKHQENDILRRKVLATTSRLMKQRRSRKQQLTKTGSKRRQMKGGGQLRKNQIRTGRLRAKMDRRNLQHHLNIIKHGRLQETKDGGETKGGSSSGEKKRKPFYSNGKPETRVKETDDNSEDEDQEVDGGGKDIERKLPGSSTTLPTATTATGGSTSSSSNPDEVPTGNGVAEDEENQEPEPKRVGDEDVEEEGDTVTVMPKFDGVDDDPQPDDGGPVEDNDNPTGGTEEEGSLEMENETNQPEGDPRGKRVNRERPNSATGSDEKVADGSGSDSAAGGGGLAASTGSGAIDGAKVNPEEQDGDDEQDSSGERDSSGVPRGERGRESSVEFADDSDDKSATNNAGGFKPSTGGGRPSVEAASNEHDDDDARDDGDLGERRTESHQGGMGEQERGRHAGNGAGPEKPTTSVGSEHDNDDPDLDYRDEMVERKKMKHGQDKDCHDDGSYNHDQDHHDHHHHHHKKWLQDAIPGEPNIDYPTLSRVNSTNFNCRDQKYPGFYADVESRCQVFHICQADGRQDSFLCPNGTIFSQLSTVCVWWNSVDCEDAPKYYDLNGLLYKKTSSSSSSFGSESDGNTQAIRPRDRIGDNDDAEEKSAADVDELIRSMRRRTSNGAANEDSGANDDSIRGDRRPIEPNLREEDEATIQRKSTNIERDSSELSPDSDQSSPADAAGTSSRLREANGGSLKHRRQRRASSRQAPPKLKSRRMSRNSRRRRIRHKPKRRA